MRVLYIGLCFGLMLLPNLVFADLLISPMRIVFDKRDRVQEVIVVNTADEDRTYSMSWSELEQQENLSYRMLTNAEKQKFASASDYIRFSPRRFTLQAGENQRIKLSLRRKSTMTEPEYRSHLKFTVIPNAVMQAKEKEADVDGVQLKLNLFLNYSIPVIIKNASTEVNATISDVQFVKNNSEGKPYTQIKLSKPKGSGLVGDITVLFKASGKSDFEPIGYNNNVAMYHETQNVKVIVPWSEPIPIESGELKIIYKGKFESADTTYTEAMLSI